MKLEEPYEGRPSRTVLWEPKGEIPLGDPISGHPKRRHYNKKRTVSRQTKCQPFAKLKELQAEPQANAFAAHLILPKPTQAHPPP